MRFLADENVSRIIVERLRGLGFAVMSISEGLSGVPDREVLEAAHLDARILITEDRDFGELVVRQRLSVRGVILLELDRLSTAAEADRAAAVIAAHVDKLPGNLVVIEPARVRVRPLPR